MPKVIYSQFLLCICLTLLQRVTIEYLFCKASIVLVFVINLYQDIGLDKMKDSANFIIGDNSQCSCFGSLKTNYDQFLANYAIPPFSPYKSTQYHPYISEHGGKNNIKKSLKKQFTPLFLQNNQGKSKNHLFIKNKQKSQKIARVRSLKKAISSQGRRYNNSSNNPWTNHNISTPISSPPKQQPYRNISFNTISYQPHYPQPQPQIRAISSMQSSTKYKYPVCQFTTPIKISYNNSHPTTQNKWNSQPTKKYEIFSSNQFHKQQKIKHINIPQHFSSVRDIRQPVVPPIILTKSQSYKVVPTSQVTNDLNVDKCETSMLQNSIQINITEVQPENEPLKYSWDKTAAPQTTNKLSIHLSQQLKINTLIPKLPSIKKMDDVMQICSQADSEQDCNSDKESIVLGRLNQYSSMLQQKKNKEETISSGIDKKVQSRLAKIGSLNSTIGHCQSTKQIKQ